MRFHTPLATIVEAEQFFTRSAGYLRDPSPHGRKEDEERFIRPLRGAPYPRLHMSVIEQSGHILCSLHLDQKKPSYAGSHAHSAEYDGPVLEEERERIIKLFERRAEQARS